MYNELTKILIVVNENNEIVQYASMGELPDSIEYDGAIPEDFREKFKPSFYMIQDGVIVENPDYVATTDSSEPEGPTVMQTVVTNLINEIGDLHEKINALGGN